MLNKLVNKSYGSNIMKNENEKEMLLTDYERMQEVIKFFQP
jgi:hypothetical protein